MKTVKLILKLLLSAVPILAAMLYYNYTIDGTGILRGDKFELAIAQSWLDGNAVGNFGNTINERSVTELYARNRTQPLDTLVLGSSRCLQITASIAGVQKSGFFNAGMTGADHRDILSTFYNFERYGCLPKNLILVLDPWIVYDSDAALNFRSDKNLYQTFLAEDLGYTDVTFEKENYSLQLKALTSPSYFQENLLYFFTNGSAEENQPVVLKDILADYEYDIRNSDGTQYYNTGFRSQTQDECDYNALTLCNVDYAQLYQFTDISPRLAGELECFVSYVQQKGVNVTFVLTPFHPTYWQMLSTNPAYTGVARSETYYRELAAEYGIKLYGSYDPALASCANTDFYDGLHIRRDSIRNYFPGINVGSDSDGVIAVNGGTSAVTLAGSTVSEAEQAVMAAVSDSAA